MHLLNKKFRILIQIPIMTVKTIMAVKTGKHKTDAELKIQPILRPQGLSWVFVAKLERNAAKCSVNRAGLLTIFAMGAIETQWTGTVVAIDQVKTCCIVQTRFRLTFVDIYGESIRT